MFTALLLLPALALLSQAMPDGAHRLFNGKDLTGWVVEGPRNYKDKDGTLREMWTIQDGVLSCAGRAFGFLRYAERQFDNFVFHVEYRMSPGGNSGIGIRTGPFDPSRSRQTRPSYFSYEVQLLDDSGKPPTKYSSGSLYRYVSPTRNPVYPAGQWNTAEVECRGPHIEIRLNGKSVLQVDQTALKEIQNKPLKGFVCLQSHTNKVDFRNIWIRALGAVPPGAKPNLPRSAGEAAPAEKQR